jgi:Bacterial regulatory helix-turn-helix protein, lysR family
MKEPDLTRVDLNLLVVFDALMRERHVGRAAERLFLSQSARVMRQPGSVNSWPIHYLHGTHGAWRQR